MPAVGVDKGPIAFNTWLQVSGCSLERKSSDHSNLQGTRSNAERLQGIVCTATGWPHCGTGLGGSQPSVV